MLESGAEQAVPGVAVRGAVPEMLAGLSRWDAGQEVILLGHAERKWPGRLGDGLARRVESRRAWWSRWTGGRYRVSVRRLSSIRLVDGGRQHASQ